MGSSGDGISNWSNGEVVRKGAHHGSGLLFAQCVWRVGGRRGMVLGVVDVDSDVVVMAVMNFVGFRVGAVIRKVDTATR